MITAILQARTSSTRLPSKVLKIVGGKPMLGFQIERLKKSKLITEIIVATTTDEADDIIEELCGHFKVKCFRGDLNDVLDRFYQASKLTNSESIMRVTGDCPLIDPILIDELLKNYQDNNYDYLCNTVKPTFPDGLDMWVFKKTALEDAWKNAFLISEREHVVTYIKNNPAKFKIGSFEQSTDHSFNRWTVDEPEDLEFIRAVVDELGEENTLSMHEVLNLLEKRPDLKKINEKFLRDEGFTKSITEDQRRTMTKTKDLMVKSLVAQDEAKKYILGQNHLLSKRPDMFSEGVWPGYYTKAKGVEVWDLDGNRYIDMSIGGIGATVLGYSDDEINRAVKKSIDLGVASSLNCYEEIELAKILIKHHPWAEMARFARAGGEAMSVAVRMIRAYSNKDKIAFCGYHGWTDWYLAASLSGDDTLKGHLLPGLSPSGVPKNLFGSALPFHYNKIEELKDIITKHGSELAGIIMEPIRNDIPENGFLLEVRKLADELKIPLVFDEISSGYRICTGGSHLSLGINPDMAIFSKSIGNGHAISAIIGKENILKASEKSFISSTCWTERLGYAAAIATLMKFERENVAEHLVKMGNMVQDVWKRLGIEFNFELDIGGIAPLSHFSFVHPKATSLKALYVQKMLDRGFLASTIFYSMYAHKEWHVKAYEQASREAFKEIKEHLDKNKVEEMLRGRPSNTGFKRLI